MMDLKVIREVDPECYESLKKELKRQQDNLELIASENIASPAVLAAAGSCLINKYAEGYPKTGRYYGGCIYADEMETLAIERAKELFHAKYANVQPHSGSTANMEAYYAIGLVPTGSPKLDNSNGLNNDTVLSMDMGQGGHISHLAKISYYGQFYRGIQYGLDPETGLIDYEQVRRLAHEYKPRLIIAGASAYSRIIDWAKFREIADEIGCYLMADIAHIAGLVVAGLHPSPLPYADIVTTTTHKTLRNVRGGLILVGSTDKKFATEEEQAAYDEKCAALAKRVDNSVFPKNQGGPLMNHVLAKAVGFKEALQPEFKEYQKQVVKNAKVLSETLMARGLKLVSGGTDNHLMLVNLIGTGVTGKYLQDILEEANITLNKNAVPNDPEKPGVTSGVRIGTPAVTTRGLKEDDMVVLGNCIADVIEKGESIIPEVKAKVKVLTEKYPIYANDVID